ncbi:MAG TPA: TolC family protein [Gemmatimonadales bacterium]|nr:TolC family protein [Gemmatimonadales bacterium]
MRPAVPIVPLLCIAASALPAQGPTLREALQIARQHNADILSARFRIDSAQGEQKIARAFPNPAFSSNPNQPWNYSVTLPLDFTPERWFRTRAAGHGTAAANWDAADMERQITFQLCQAFTDVLLSERLRELATERHDILRQVLLADSARLRAGDLPERDVNKAELELARAEAEMQRAAAHVHATRLALQLLMGVTPPDTAFGVSGDLAYAPVEIPVDSLRGIASRRPDLRAAQDRVAQTRSLHSLATAQWIPVPIVSFTRATAPFGTDGLFSNGTRNAIGFGFTVPLWDWNGGARDRSRAGVAQAQLEATHLEAQVANDIATAVDAYRSARLLAERYEGGLLDRARRSLETARYAYGSGAISLLELLDAIGTWSDTRSDYYTALHDYWISVYAVGNAAGRDFIP